MFISIFTSSTETKMPGILLQSKKFFEDRVLYAKDVISSEYNFPTLPTPHYYGNLPRGTAWPSGTEHTPSIGEIGGC